jgi:hypothetical protein
MDLRMQWTAFGLMGLALVAAVGIGLARSGEMDAMTVSRGDYEAAVQERMGYAITLDHWVDRAHMMSRTWSWQERRGYMIAVDHWMDRTHGMMQAAMGWRITAEHYAHLAAGKGQEAKGWQITANHAWARAHALEQAAQSAMAAPPGVPAS